MKDIIVTWPKSRALESYLVELEAARTSGAVINYRVSSRPQPTPERCYVVYDGFVRGYSRVIEVCWRPVDTVRRVDGGGFWPAGWYVVRRPSFIRCQEIAMPGFQGWRWFDREQVT